MRGEEVGQEGYVGQARKEEVMELTEIERSRIRESEVN